MSACQSGHAEIVRLLLDAGADRTLLSGVRVLWLVFHCWR